MNQGFIVPLFFLALLTLIHISDDYVKEETLRLVTISRFPEKVFSVSEKTMEELGEKEELTLQCTDSIFKISSSDIKPLEGDFELTENEVVSCDTF